ncbi:MAG: hypothetical protein ACMUEL_08175 [Flavobacteriales bacterium Tduv]
MSFCGFRLENHRSDHMILYIFFNKIVSKKVYELLLKKINKELKKNQVIVLKQE